MNFKSQKTLSYIITSLSIAIILIIGAIAFKSDIFKNISDQDTQILFSIMIVSLVIAVASYFKPLRKTLGLLLVILGALVCFSVMGTPGGLLMFSVISLALGIPAITVGLVSGISMIIIGGLFLFV